MTDELRSDEIAALYRWASEHGAMLDVEGHCGIGRECVGVLLNHQWLDYADEPSLAPPQGVAPDAYHKHDCLAVLGRGDDAIHQLFEWVMFIEESGGVVIEHVPPDRLDVIGLAAMLSGRPIPATPAMRRPSQLEGGGLPALKGGDRVDAHEITHLDRRQARLGAGESPTEPSTPTDASSAPAHGSPL